MTAQTPDPTMAEITEAVALGHEGDTTTARTRLRRLWDRIGPAGDPFHRCVLAHYMADLHDHPAQALVWDVRALDAAQTLTDERVQHHHDSLRIAGFYPSLHLNLADNFRRLGSFDAASEHIRAARRHEDALGEDGYGTMIRRAISEVAEAVERRRTDKRASAPAP
ncbi:hypothetical protein [Saccharothrix coeruleofusca]|uniref:Tetratricopeptide repeat protein n=1 Tax=Saccharothrix coeruleofusca TaxID=33919 RepID=A0A918ARC4_9PSEU|nr:hypothetical protein [Saccharothrix coeruleofusca]MBP2337474.1 hypothetical protein [Saccharothrix coeruleofusca]GGP65540.1 hypothetical protein GCM10010185_42940 [Saccharothrix coeruleofusca]